jgi:hypothetical protein
MNVGARSQDRRPLSKPISSTGRPHGRSDRPSGSDRVSPNARPSAEPKKIASKGQSPRSTGPTPASSASEEKRELQVRYDELCETLRQKQARQDELAAQKARILAQRTNSNGGQDSTVETLFPLGHQCGDRYRHFHPVGRCGDLRIIRTHNMRSTMNCAVRSRPPRC